MSQFSASFLLSGTILINDKKIVLHNLSSLLQSTTYHVGILASRLHMYLSSFEVMVTVRLYPFTLSRKHHIDTRTKGSNDSRERESAVVYLIYVSSDTCTAGFHALPRGGAESDFSALILILCLRGGKQA
jgi:hypothetical protein